MFCVEQQIDYEIEELKRKYGMMSRATSTVAPSHTISAMQRYTSNVLQNRMNNIDILAHHPTPASATSAFRCQHDSFIVCS